MCKRLGNAPDFPKKPVRLSSESPMASGKMLFNGDRRDARRAARVGSISTLTPMRAAIAEAYAAEEFDGRSLCLTVGLYAGNFRKSIGTPFFGLPLCIWGECR